MKYIHFICLLCMLLPQPLLSQTQKQWLKYGDKSFEEKDYYGASVYYGEAVLADSSNLYVVNRYCESLRHVNNYKLAERYYQYIVSTDGNRAYADALFWLAMMQKNNGKYVEARKNFLTYLKSNKDKSSYNYRKSQQEVKSCEYALQLIKNPVRAQVYNLQDSINTVNSEFAAIPCNDSVLYFSSLQYHHMIDNNAVKDYHSYTGIYRAEKVNDLWIRRTKLDSAINRSESHNANGCFSPDRKRFYFSRCDDDMKCMIYVSDSDSGIFNAASPLPETINHPGSNTTQPFICLIDSSEVLFFVSNRPGGSGEFDIWYSTHSGKLFSKPVNAGPKINSIEDDICPYYDTLSHTLYFSSPWHYGLGGWDIFRSAGKPGSFSKPENIGYPLNSGANDLYFRFRDSSYTGFLTSNRKGAITRDNETCCNDLWSFEFMEEEPEEDSMIVLSKTITVKDPKLADLQELKNFLPIKLYFHNDEPNPRTKDTVTALTYEETFEEYRKLQPLYKENYSGSLAGEDKTTAEANISSFFSNLVEGNFVQLEKFASLLKKNLDKGYKLDVTIKGNASPLANSDYNLNLTLRRISSLENYLKHYEGGVLQPYLSNTASNGGKLKLIRIPFGEYKAEEYVSDNLNDQKNSVYSISAAMDRNIEIMSVSYEHKDTLEAQISFVKEVHNFRSLKSGEKVEYAFKFKNTGQRPLSIIEVKSPCNCIEVITPGAAIAPGKWGEVTVRLNTAGLLGKKAYHIVLITNGIPAFKELSITAEIK